MTDEELDQPATRRDVRDAVAGLATKDELAAAVAKLATKDELAAAVAPLATRAEMELGFARLMEAILTVQRSILPAIHTEVRTVLGITEEEWQRRVAVLDEKYKDLPPRVTAVEDDLDAHKDFRLHKRPRVP